MKIGIDARFVGPKGTGIGKYTEKLVENLQQIDTKNQYYIFLKEDNWHFLKLNNKRFKKVLADISWYSLEEQLKMPAIFKKQNLDVLHIPHFNVPILYNQKFVVTIHDLIHLSFPETSATTKDILTFQAKKFGFQKILNHAIKKSAKIISPSKFVKGQIINRFHVDPSKITVTYEAAEEEYFKKSNVKSSPRLDSKSERAGEAGQMSKIAKKDTPFLLYVGNAYPHKNLNRLLDAVKILTGHSRSVPRNDKAHSGGETRFKLIIVCPRDVFSNRLGKEIQARELQNYVELKGYLGPDELAKFFQKATAYISPSLSEGFGIPALNAMAAKTPVLASNIPTFREVYGNSVLYFDPDNAQDIAQKIEKLIKSKRFRDNLIKNGEMQVKKYSWQKMAEETLKIYQEAASK